MLLIICNYFTHDAFVGRAQSSGFRSSAKSNGRVLRPNSIATGIKNLEATCLKIFAKMQQQVPLI